MLYSSIYIEQCFLFSIQYHSKQTKQPEMPCLRRFTLVDGMLTISRGQNASQAKNTTPLPPRW